MLPLPARHCPVRHRQKSGVFRPQFYDGLKIRQRPATDLKNPSLFRHFLVIFYKFQKFSVINPSFFGNFSKFSKKKSVFCRNISTFQAYSLYFGAKVLSIEPDSHDILFRIILNLRQLSTLFLIFFISIVIWSFFKNFGFSRHKSGIFGICPATAGNGVKKSVIFPAFFEQFFREKWAKCRTVINAGPA